MKLCFLFLLLTFSFTANVNTIFCQENAFSLDGPGLEVSASDSDKEIKRKFRQLRRKAPSRALRKKLHVFEKEYFSLLAQDKRIADSITVQKAKIEGLLAEIEKGRMSQEKLAKLRAENDSLRIIMKRYVQQIDSVNTLNVILKEKRDNARDYYFNLADFEEPKIYYYYNQDDPELSQYWKLSSDRDSNFLITEVYGTNFEQFEYFKEQYDSIRSKVVEYTMINGLDSVFSTIGSTDVYHWVPKEPIAYSIRYSTSYYNGSYTKKREFGSVDSMEIMGNTLEVLRFQDEYTFYMDGEVTFSRMQQSFYAKEIGMVRFLRFDEVNKTNATYILKAIYTEQEWEQVQDTHH